jgi:hypothetical protein
MKWGLCYKLLIQANDKGDTLSYAYYPPNSKDPNAVDASGVGTSEDYNASVTISYHVTRGTFSNYSEAEIVLTNIDWKDQRLIFRDAYTPPPVHSKFVQLSVGFWSEMAGALPIIFEGVVFEAYTRKSGTELHTVIKCKDIGHVAKNKWFSQMYPPGTPVTSAYIDMAKGVSASNKLIVADKPNTLGRRTVFFGPTDQITKAITTAKVFYDNTTVHILADEMFVKSDPLFIGVKYGLLNTIERGAQTLTVNMVLEPNAKVGQVARILPEEDINANEAIYAGDFIIASIEHVGRIGPTNTSSNTTTLVLATFGRTYNYQDNLLLPDSLLEISPMAKYVPDEIEYVNNSRKLFYEEYDYKAEIEAFGKDPEEVPELDNKVNEEAYNTPNWLKGMPDEDTDLKWSETGSA